MFQSSQGRSTKSKKSENIARSHFNESDLIFGLHTCIITIVYDKRSFQTPTGTTCIFSSHSMRSSPATSPGVGDGPTLSTFPPTSANRFRPRQPQRVTTGPPSKSRRGRNLDARFSDFISWCSATINVDFKKTLDQHTRCRRCRCPHHPQMPVGTQYQNVDNPVVPRPLGMD